MWMELKGLLLNQKIQFSQDKGVKNCVVNGGFKKQL